MKKIIIQYVTVTLSLLLCQSAFSQTEKDAKALGLPGDNLDLYAVLTLFQKSKTIEDFEKSLNEQKTGINNLDLDLDKKVDFIKVITKKEGDSFTFILEVSLSKSESQDVAVIIVDKDKAGKVSMQIVGDESLYGKNYVIEPKTSAAPALTANPAYTGPAPATSAPATTTVVIETVPIVQYVYSPVYVPYYPPYHYGYYPPYFAAFTVIAVGIYRHNNYYHHSGYYGGHYHGGGNTVIINNKNIYNNYNKNKMRSATVTRNASSGRYKAANANRAAAHPTAGTSNRTGKNSSATTRQGNVNTSHVSKGTAASKGTSGGASRANLTKKAAPGRTSVQSASQGARRTPTGGGASRRR